MSMTLESVIAELESFDLAWTIYAQEPWTLDSVACVELETNENPNPCMGLGLTYFLEVSIALEVKISFQGASNDWLCRRIIQFAINDA